MKNTTRFDFEWSVPTGECNIVAKHVDSHFGGTVNEELIQCNGGQPKSYRPLDTCPNLHNIFAEQVIDGHTVLEFVKKYGFLRIVQYEPNIDDCENLLHESSRDILQEATMLRNFLEQVKKSHRLISENRTNFKKKLVIVDTLVRNFHSHTLQARLIPMAEDRTQLTIQFFPRNLISWLWIRAAEDACNNNIWRTCIRCSEAFSVKNYPKRKIPQTTCGKPACTKWRQRNKNSVAYKSAIKNEG
jgi:hypothetical protein